MSPSLKIRRNIQSEIGKKIQIKDLAELHNIIKTYPYSNANFYDGYRKADNIISFNNLLIYDIDNNKDTPNLTIKQAEILLTQNQIHALIMPTKSNNKEKKMAILHKDIESLFQQSLRTS